MPWFGDSWPILFIILILMVTIILNVGSSIQNNLDKCDKVQCEEVGDEI